MVIQNPRATAVSRLALPLLIAPLLALPTLASADDSAGAVALDPVLVKGAHAPDLRTATKTDATLGEVPQSVTAIGREMLDEQNAQSLNQALRFVPGVQAEQYGVDNVYDFFTIRGFAANLNGVFRDGLQLLSANNSFAGFRLEPYGVERLELQRGPASALYGGTNPGGLVNYVSKRPTATPLRELAANFGSFGWKETRADFSGPLPGADTFAYRLTALARESGTQVDFEKNDRRFIAPALSWKPGADTTLTLLGQYQRDDAGHLRFLPADATLLANPNGRLPPSRNDGEPGFNGFQRKQGSAGWLLEHRIDDTWSLRQQLRYDRLSTAFRDVFGLALDPADPAQRTLLRASYTSDDHARLFGVDSNLTGRFVTGSLQHTVLLGVDYQNDRFDTRAGSDAVPSIDIYAPVYGAAISPPPLFADNATHLSQVGVYVQEQLRFAGRGLLLLSGRHDWLSSRVNDDLASAVQRQSSDRYTGRAGLSWQLDHGLLPYASVATSFLPVIGANSAGRAYKPESGRQWEAGVKLDTSSLRSLLTLAAFRIRRENVLTPSTDPADPFGQVQAGAQRSQGVELGLDARPLPALHLVGAWTLQDVKVVRSNAGNQGLQPVATPARFGSLHARYQLADGLLSGFGLKAAVRYQGETNGDDLNSFKVPAFTLFDAGLDYQWQALRLALDVQNLADNRHFSACQNGSCFYGATRSVNGSVSWRW